MKRIPVALMAVLMLTGINPVFASVEESTKNEQLRMQDSRLPEQPEYQGKPLSYWLEVIRDQNEEEISLAFDAIRSMGRKAWRAVPELTRLVAAPFTPIRIGADSEEVIACKLYDIEIRSEAVDALASIGEAASPATTAVVDWALTLRVVPGEILSKDENERFIELVALDAEYRIQVSATLMRFGSANTPILLRLLKSSDIEKRQFAVVILGGDTLTVATELMNSNDCEDKELAIAILRDMAPFVSKVYLAQLSRTLVCNAD
jgi:hypothetical protein